MPNGECTRSVNEMIKAWEDIYTPICKGLNVSVTAFDPGIRFRVPETNCYFDLPVSIAIRIRDLINKEKP